MVLRFTRRILRYDLPLSAAGALATWWVTPGLSAVSWRAAVVDLTIRFVAIAVTAGYVLSLLLYRHFGRTELPLYLVAGRQAGWFAAVAYGVVSLGLLAIAAIIVLLAGR